MVRETVTAPIEQETLNIPAQFFDDDEAPEDVALANIISEFGSDSASGKVNVYRIIPNKPLAFVRSYSPLEFSMESLQSEYGPGDYQIRVYAGRGLKARKNITIDKPLNVPTNLIAGHMQQIQPQGQDKLLESMNAGFQRMGEMFANALSALAANQPKPKTTMETLQELQMMREIMGVNNQPAPSADPMQLIETALALSEKINPKPAGENDLLMEGLKAFAPVLGAAMQHQAQQPAHASISKPDYSPQVPAFLQVNPPAPVSTPLPDQESSPDMMMTIYLKTLVANAKNDSDPVTYANAIIDFVGDDAARDFVARPDWFEQIVSRNAEAANCRAWFEELRLLIIELTKPEEPGIKAANENETGDQIATRPDNSTGDNPAS